MNEDSRIRLYDLFMLVLCVYVLIWYHLGGWYDEGDTLGKRRLARARRVSGGMRRVPHPSPKAKGGGWLSGCALARSEQACRPPA